ncbi:hypothetical protein FOZ60_002673 [Perkinsus olseni]|uniref:Uncharacterized protein n=1 Tax=Perkinsus olseni TaxID=32597 RepID=A0A7J6PIM3_PEROL|nr:hypothetical protein FOZ60_002673 [Perkinsus olseni]
MHHDGLLTRPAHNHVSPRRRRFTRPSLLHSSQPARTDTTVPLKPLVSIVSTPAVRQTPLMTCRRSHHRMSTRILNAREGVGPTEMHRRASFTISLLTRLLQGDDPDRVLAESLVCGIATRRAVLPHRATRSSSRSGVTDIVQEIFGRLANCSDEESCEIEVIDEVQDIIAGPPEFFEKDNIDEPWALEEDAPPPLTPPKRSRSEGLIELLHCYDRIQQQAKVVTSAANVCLEEMSVPPHKHRKNARRGGLHAWRESWLDARRIRMGASSMGQVRGREIAHAKTQMRRVMDSYTAKFEEYVAILDDINSLGVRHRYTDRRLKLYQLMALREEPRLKEALADSACIAKLSIQTYVLSLYKGMAALYGKISLQAQTARARRDKRASIPHEAHTPVVTESTNLKLIVALESSEGAAEVASEGHEELPIHNSDFTTPRGSVRQADLSSDSVSSHSNGAAGLEDTVDRRHTKLVARKKAVEEMIAHTRGMLERKIQEIVSSEFEGALEGNSEWEAHLRRARHLSSERQILEERIEAAEQRLAEMSLDSSIPSGPISGRKEAETTGGRQQTIPYGVWLASRKAQKDCLAQRSQFEEATRRFDTLSAMLYRRGIALSRKGPELPLKRTWGSRRLCQIHLEPAQEELITEARNAHRRAVGGIEWLTTALEKLAHTPEHLWEVKAADVNSALQHLPAKIEGFTHVYPGYRELVRELLGEEAEAEEVLPDPEEEEREEFERLLCKWVISISDSGSVPSIIALREKTQEGEDLEIFDPSRAVRLTLYGVYARIVAKREERKSKVVVVDKKRSSLWRPRRSVTAPSLPRDGRKSRISPLQRFKQGGRTVIAATRLADTRNRATPSRAKTLEEEDLAVERRRLTEQIAVAEKLEKFWKRRITRARQIQLERTEEDGPAAAQTRSHGSGSGAEVTANPEEEASESVVGDESHAQHSSREESVDTEDMVVQRHESNPAARHAQTIEQRSAVETLDESRSYFIAVGPAAGSELVPGEEEGRTAAQTRGDDLGSERQIVGRPVVESPATSVGEQDRVRDLPPGGSNVYGGRPRHGSLSSPRQSAFFAGSSDLNVQGCGVVAVAQKDPRRRRRSSVSVHLVAAAERLGEEITQLGDLIAAMQQSSDKELRKNFPILRDRLEEIPPKTRLLVIEELLGILERKSTAHDPSSGLVAGELRNEWYRLKSVLMGVSPVEDTHEDSDRQCAELGASEEAAKASLEDALTSMLVDASFEDYELPLETEGSAVVTWDQSLHQYERPVSDLERQRPEVDNVHSGPAMAQPVQKAHDADSPTIRCKANEFDEYQERRYEEWRKRVDDMFEEINAEKLRQDQRQLQEEEEEEEKISAGSRLAPKPRQRLSQCFLARRYFTKEELATHIVAPPSDRLPAPGRRVPFRARRIGATAGGRQSVEASKTGEGLRGEHSAQHGLSTFTGIFRRIINASSDGLVPRRLVAPARMVEDTSEAFSPQEDGRGEDKFPMKSSRLSGYSLVGTMFSAFKDSGGDRCRSFVHRTTCVHEVDIISRARASAVVYLPQLETVLSPWERRKLKRRRLLDRRQKFRRYCLRPLPSPSLLIIDGFGLCRGSNAARSVGGTSRRTEQMRLWKMHSVTSSRIVKCVPAASSSTRQLNVRQKRSGPSLARRGPPTASPTELFGLGPIAPAGCEPPVETEVTRATSCCDRASPKVKRRLIEATLEDGRATTLYQEPVVQSCDMTPVEGCGTNRSRQSEDEQGSV